MRINRSELSGIPQVEDVIIDSCGCEHTVVGIQGQLWHTIPTLVCSTHLAENEVSLANTIVNSRKAEIKLRLSQIDNLTPRLTRDILLGNGSSEITVNGTTTTPSAYLATLEAEAVSLRSELTSL